MHAVKPVTRGARWALTVVFMVHDELPPIAEPGLTFYRSCVLADSTTAYSFCRHEWASLMHSPV